MKKRILIGLESYNICQENVVSTLLDYFVSNNNYEIKVVNLSLYSNNLLNKNSKLDFISSVPDINVASKNKSRIITRVFDSLELRDVFKSFNPDIVISTHFYVNYITSFFNSEKIINSKIISIVPDYACTTWWIANKDDVDYYLVNSDMVKREFIKNGVDSEKIVLFSVPVNLSQDISKDMIVKRYNLNKDIPIYLFLGNSNLDYDYFKDLAKRKYNFNLIFVCGKNTFLKNKCECFIRDNGIRNVAIISFAKDIFNIMNVADVVISRAIGYNLNYITRLKKPSIILSSNNSIYRKNSNYLCKKNYAVKVQSPFLLSRKVDSFLKYPFIVKSMANKLSKQDNKYSFKVISDLIEKISVQ